MWGWYHGGLVVTAAQLQSTKPELRFCTGSNHAHSVLDIPDCEDLWPWSRAGNKAKHLLSVNHTTKTIHHHHHHYHHHHHHYCTTLINYAWTHRFCTGLNTAHSVLHISDGEDLWQWFQLEIRLNTFCQSAILPKQFIIIFIIIIIPLEMSVVLFGSNSHKVSALKKVFQPERLQLAELGYILLAWLCEMKQLLMLFTYISCF